MAEEIVEGVRSNYLELILPERANGRVHSLFRNSLNLALDGELIHIGKRKSGLAAWGVTVADAAVEELLNTLRGGELAYWRSGELLIYGQRKIWRIDLASFQSEDCRVASPETFDQQHLRFLLERLTTYRLPSRTGLDMDGNTRSLLQQFLRADWGDEAFFRRFHHHFAGRGLGLTPSGDDFLMGMLIMATATASALDWRKRLCDEYAEFSTTDVSKAYFRALLRGYTSSPFLSLLQTVREGRLEEVDLEIQNIAQYGHTSGWDTLLGIYYWLMKFFNLLNEV